MHRASETVGNLAAALAKAQLELANPLKTLTATIPSPFPREADRTFRYASLSDGLEIIRRCLGQQEIATVQTTTVDGQAGLIQLTTLLAHSSGEWMSSEWPVCSVAETVSPHRLGAALTYARRYALFAFVGIAGEDDLDAPDASPAQETHSNTNGGHPTSGYTNGRAAGSMGHSGNGKRRLLPRELKPMLAPEESSATRSRLLSELARCESAEQVTAWAFRELPVKNSLGAEDAKLIEEAFRQKQEFLGSVDGGSAVAEPAPARGLPFESAAPQCSDADTPRVGHANRDAVQVELTKVDRARGRIGGRIDKSVLAISEPRRYRDKEHLKFVATHACLICGRQPSDPHHLRFTQPRALGRKVSDEYTVPLCRMHHREVHRAGNEPHWWQKYNLEPLPVAEGFWKQTHPVWPNPPVLPAEAAGPQAPTSDSIEAASSSKGARNRKTKPNHLADPR